MDIIIYGAQSIALSVYNSINVLMPEYSILCFLVTKLDGNPSVLGGIPVYELKEYAQNISQGRKDCIEILIATPENVMQEIEDELHGEGFKWVVRITSLRLAGMVQSAFIKTGKYTPLAVYPVGAHKPDICVFKMVHEMDKRLLKIYDEPEYIVQLQVGAEHAGRKMAVLSDNIGDNISLKNGNYSELTGLYWIWKNILNSASYSNVCYYGLAHYRRMLELTEDDLLRIQDNNIDVIMPFPMPYEPDIEAHHKRYLSKEEWQAVLRAIEELQPEYAAVLDSVLGQSYFYNYNILLAKKNVLDDYCRWLFPLLFKIEEINDYDGSKKQNRYIGYIGETLQTIYFMHNKYELRIAHVGCKFMA